MRCCMVLSLWLCLIQSTLAESPAQLPNTQPLTWDDDLADRMMDGLHRFVERKIEHAVANRKQFWNWDTSSPEAYERSIAPNRERLKKIIGLVDQRVPVQMEVLWPIHQAPPSLPPSASHSVARVRWTVFDGVHGEGLLLRPIGKPIGAVITLPDADQTPEQALANQANICRQLVDDGFVVLVPMLINRQDTFSGRDTVALTNQPHREWIWRQAYHMGRHIIGLEVQKVLAAAEWMQKEIGESKRVGIAGYGEGGLVAMFAAAVEPRLAACLVSGYFGPHERPWEEPIYRHVWSLHQEFGDAELATLIAPRPLVVDASEYPPVDGPPAVQQGRRGGAAIGKLQTPTMDQVRQEFDRIGKLLPEGFQTRNFVAATIPTARISEEAAELFAQSFGQSLQTSKSTFNIVFKNEDAERQRRQVLELEHFIQRLVRESDHTRDKFFPVTALAQQAKASVAEVARLQANAAKPPNSGESGYVPPTAAKFSESTAKFRDYFRDEVLGKFDDPLLPFNARSRKIYDNDKWVGYDVVLDVFPDVFAWGVLLLPKDLKPGEKRPVVVCQHGRNGVPKVVIENDEKAYHDYAAKLAERGFIVFAPHNPYRGEDKYRFLSRKANCVKGSLFSFILAQHEQILNWLASLPQVDPDRIAFYGLSYGGETAVRIPPLLLPDRKPNVAASVGESFHDSHSNPGYCLSICSADFNDWARKIASTDAKYSFMFTVEWEMPYFDMGSTFNYAEMVALLAPRPFMVERGHSDGVAPDEWVAYEYAKVRRLYDTLGLGDRTDIEFFDGLHEINGKGTFEFLHKHLKWPKP